MKNLLNHLLIICLTFCISCGQQFAFRKEMPSLVLSNGVYFLPYSKTTQSFQQLSYEKNEMSQVFRVLDRDGFTITNLQPSDFIVTENGNPVNSFELSSENPNSAVDIVFVIDITNSMTPIIDSVKQNVTEFVRNLNSKKLKSNICLVTFKDTVEKACTSFVEDDPGTTTVDENSQSFLDELNRVVASGGGDIPENQLDGIQQAVLQTPWHTGVQKSIIMITNSNFHYAPDYAGDAGANAPYYENVVDLLIRDQVMSFTIGTTTPGYTSSFRARPAIADATNGEHFDIGAVVRDPAEMNKIFGVIAERLATNYTINYAAEDNGLDPRLPLIGRNISVQLRNPIPGATIRTISNQSSYPSGQIAYPSSWPLRQISPIVSDSLEVKINGVPSPIVFSLVDGNIQFATSPARGSQIEVKYEYQALRDNVRSEPIFAKQPPTGFKFQIIFNGIQVKSEDVRVTATAEGFNLIEPQSSVFEDSDPYKIKVNGGLFVTFSVTAE